MRNFDPAKLPPSDGAPRGTGCVSFVILAAMFAIIVILIAYR